MIPPVTMDFFTALAWCEAGWAIRPEICKVSALFTGQVSVAGDLPLFWISGEPAGNPGVFFYASDAATGVNTGNVLTLALMKRLDWTTLPPSGTSTNMERTNPNAARAAAAAASSGGGSGGGSGSLPVGSPGGSGGSFGGSGGGGGGSGGGSPGSGGKPARTAPELTVVVNNTTFPTCVPLREDETPNPNPVTDDFTVDVSLADQTGYTGQQFFYSVRWGCAGKSDICLHGIITVGGTQSGAFTVTNGPRGADVRVMATANLPNSSLTTQGSDSSAMRDTNCGVCPDVTITFGPGNDTKDAGTTLSLTGTATTTDGHTLHYDWLVSGEVVATGASTSYVLPWDLGVLHFTFRVTSDCGSHDETTFDITVVAPTCDVDHHWDHETHTCVPDGCAEGWHWDAESFSCVPD
jgi:hypothetical protein